MPSIKEDGEYLPLHFVDIPIVSYFLPPREKFDRLPEDAVVLRGDV